MKVKDICTKDVRTCTRESNLASVGAMMWEGDFGIVPVVDADGRVEGVVTDRDLAIALSTRNRPASGVTVGDLPLHGLRACGPDDDVHLALDLMAKDRMRRLPVVGPAGRLYGVLSVNDLILAARDVRGGDAPTTRDVMETLKAVCAHWQPVLAG